MQENKIPVIVIFAPTASGKTALTKELFCEQGSHFIFKAEIISADSQAVYKGMDIGTAKPDPDFCKLIPHHLINILNPNQQYNVSDFVDDADRLCNEIYARGNIPVVCGGTGFYIRNFLYGVPKTPVSDENLRNKLKERILKEGNQALYEELKQIDPQSASRIHINDAYRICRALEIYYQSGKTRTDFSIKQTLRSKYDFTFIVLEPERALLYERITERVNKMIDLGLENEIQTLIKAGYTKDSPGLKAIGYHEWFEYEDKEKIRNAIIHNSKKYAKKQYTYIRDIPQSIIIPFNSSDANIAEVAQVIKKGIAHLNSVHIIKKD